MEDKETLVSIGMPVYNGEQSIRKALDSLLSQTYTNFELIISDNASTDNTGKICRDYANKDKRIRYVRQKENVGIVRNFPFVLNEAKGRYFMWAAHDDWWAPSFISTLKTALEKHPNYGVAMSSIERVREDGTILEKVLFTGNDDLTRLNYCAVLLRLFTKKFPVFFMYGLFRANLIKKILERPSPQTTGGDKIIIAEASLATHFYSTPRILHRRTERFKADYTAEIYNEFKGASRPREKWASNYAREMLRRLVGSPLVPLRRKILVPLFWLILLWGNRYALAKEFFPRTFRMGKKLKEKL